VARQASDHFLKKWEAAFLIRSSVSTAEYRGSMVAKRYIDQPAARPGAALSITMRTPSDDPDSQRGRTSIGGVENRSCLSFMPTWQHDLIQAAPPAGVVNAAGDPLSRRESARMAPGRRHRGNGEHGGHHEWGDALLRHGDWTDVLAEVTAGRHVGSTAAL
jgi:hypothetical protein